MKQIKIEELEKLERRGFRIAMYAETKKADGSTVTLVRCTRKGFRPVDGYVATSAEETPPLEAQQSMPEAFANKPDHAPADIELMQLES